MSPAVWVESFGTPSIGLNPPPWVHSSPRAGPFPHHGIGPNGDARALLWPLPLASGPFSTPSVRRHRCRSRQCRQWDPSFVGTVSVSQLLPDAAPCPSPFLGCITAPPTTPLSPHLRLQADSLTATTGHYHPTSAFLLRVGYLFSLLQKLVVSGGRHAASAAVVAR